VQPSSQPPVTTFPCQLAAAFRYSPELIAVAPLGMVKTGEENSPAKNATLFGAIYVQKRSFCQDRLGTNIRKTPKKVAFFAPFAGA
jgi:hypothetical protein